ncbi:MAG: hypothetical protein V4577_13480 [Bacteroidota bacterium]
MKVYHFSPFPPQPDNQNAGLAKRLKRADLNASLFSSDAAFDRMYPEHFRLLSLKHWTPLAIARKAAAFLAEPGARVLDIGSGIGKFCLAAGYEFPETDFYGVEQRHQLVYHAEGVKVYTGLRNVNLSMLISPRSTLRNLTISIFTILFMKILGRITPSTTPSKFPKASIIIILNIYSRRWRKNHPVPAWRPSIF